MKIKNLFQIGLLSAFLLVGSCSDDYDGRFDKLEQQIQDLLAQTAGGAQLAASITSLQSQVTALSAAVGTNNAGLTTSLTALQTKINALQAELGVLAANQTSSSANQALSATALSNAIVALNADVDALKLDLTALLENSNIINGDLLINDSSLAAVQAFGTKVAIVTGKVTVSISSSTAVEVNKVMSLLSVVFGDVAITSNKTLDVSNLASVGGNLILAIKGNLVFTKLVSVNGTVTNTDDAATLLVDFEKLATSGIFNGGSVTFGTATSVKLNGGAITNVTANAANVVQMWAANNTTAGGLTISATKAASAITIAGRVDTGASTVVGLPLSVTGSATSTLSAAAVTHVTTLGVTAKTVDFTALTNANGAIGLTSTTPVAFPALTTTVAGAITANSAVSFSAPVLKTVASLSLTAATTIEAPLTELDITSDVVAALATSLTIGTDAAVTSADLNTDFPVLKTLWLNGTGAYQAVDIIADMTAGASLANETITSIKLSGKFGVVDLSGVGASPITKIETAGNFTSLSVDNFDLMTVLTLEHGNNPTVGHDLTVTGNALLTTFTTTQLDFVKELTITANPKLASFDLSSVKSLILTVVQYKIDISGNFLTATAIADATGMKGSYTAFVAAAGSTPAVPEDFTQASLATLKPFMLAIANGALATTATASTTSLIDFTYLYPSASTPANTAGSPAAFDSGVAITADDVVALNTL